MNSLASYVIGRRESLGLNQTELAARAGLPATTINKIERGTIKVPVPDARRKLAHGLGVRHVDILVAAGELIDDEIAGVAPRWPTDDPARVRLYEIIESLPDSGDWLDYTIKTLGIIQDSAR